LFEAPRKVLAKTDMAAFRVVLRQYNSEFDRSKLGVVREEATVNNMEGMLVMLLSGSYIGYLPTHYAQPWVDSGKLFAIDTGDSGYVSQHALITKSSGQESLALEKFVSLIREASSAPQGAQTETDS
jgi:DNA-binding transcriptional LysR family regulator